MSCVRGACGAGRRVPALNLPHVPGDLPAIAADASIEAARCAWRWQAGGGQVWRDS